VPGSTFWKRETFLALPGVTLLTEQFLVLSVRWPFYLYLRNVKNLNEVKGKAIPLQAWTGPEGSRRLRFPDFKTIGTRRW